MNIKKNNSILIILVTFFICSACSGKNDNNPTNPTPPPPPPPVTNEVDLWYTSGDQSVLLYKTTGTIAFGTTANSFPFIDVDSNKVFQTIEGFGYTLTGGSASLINAMNPTDASLLLNELFGNGTDAIGVSYLRLSLGASDLSASVFSYDDMPAGQTDPALANFSLSQDTIDLIPVIKKILAINPTIKFMASPWSAPAWMKDNGNTIGGKLKPEYYAVYASYIVKYIQAMKAKGITIDALTPQNEPLNPDNNPSMLMTAAEQTDFIKNHLGPAFQSAGITTRIIIYDHNCDKPEYPISVLNDAVAKSFISGSAFHLYAGDISALSTVYTAHPDKGIYFTEQWTSSTGNFGGDLKWHLKNVMIGSMRNHSRIVLEWNLANNPAFGPHTPGGCTQCKGAITINGSSYTRNVSYYIIAHASKFVPAGSKRIASTNNGNLYTVAFVTPAGKKVLLVLNDGSTTEKFNIRYKGKWFNTSLDAGNVATYIW